jgi:hypothetical protein
MVGVGHAQAQAHIVSNAGDQLAAGAETAQHGFASLVHVASGLPGRAWHGASSFPGRVRDLAVRTFSTSNTEPITTAVSNGSAGVAAKGVGRMALIVCGGVVGAAAGLCGAGLVGVGPGAGLFHDDGGTAAPPAAHTRPYVPPGTRGPTPSREHAHSHTSAKHPRTHHAGRPNRSHYPRKKDKRGGHHYTPQSEHAARRQGLDSQAPPAVPEPEPEPAPEPEPEYTGGENGGGGGPSAAETESKKQFDLP